MIVITRKIQVLFDVPDTEIKQCYEKVFGWQRIVHRAANWIATHQHLQENIKELFYLSDGVKVKLADMGKDEDGILTTSRDNTTYQLLSKHFKGEAPMGMLSSLNILIAKTYKKESNDVRFGLKSLRTYRNNIPMPVPAAGMRNWNKMEDGNYSFFMYGLQLKTRFGKDLSGNEVIMDRALCANPEYKLCDSSLALEKKGGKWKMFLLAVFSFEKQEVGVDPGKQAVCKLGIDYPIVIAEKKDRMYTIGTAEEFLHRRLAIQGALHRLQKACRYNNGGKGRKKKLEAIERFKKLERDYVDSRVHLYSRMLVEYCIKKGIGTIVLSNYSEAEEETKEETDKGKFLLSNWSYFNLSGKIEYKAAKYGIVVVKE